MIEEASAVLVAFVLGSMAGVTVWRWHVRRRYLRRLHSLHEYWQARQRARLGTE